MPDMPSSTRLPLQACVFWIRIALAAFCVDLSLPVAVNAAPARVAPAQRTGELTLPQAEALAIENSPLLRVDTNRIAALQAKSVYEGQLPDPTLRFGPQNVEANDFSLGREAMSMWVVGLSQAFPPWGTLGLRTRQFATAAKAARLIRDADIARIREQVRDAWVDVLYYGKVLDVDAREQLLLRQVVDASLALYRAGKGSAASTLRAKLARDALIDRIRAARERLASAESDLQRLLVVPVSGSRIAPVWPSVPTPPTEPVLLKSLTHNPILSAGSQEVKSQSVAVQIARRGYLPKFQVGVSYGIRTGARSAGGARLPDLWSAGINISLPIFPADRQAQQVDAAQARTLQAQNHLYTQFLRLAAQTRSAYAAYVQLRDRVRLTRQTLVPEAVAAADATLNAYRSDRAALTDVLRAEDNELRYRLLRWRLQRALTDSMSQLDFLATIAPENGG